MCNDYVNCFINIRALKKKSYQLLIRLSQKAELQCTFFHKVPMVATYIEE